VRADLGFPPAGHAHLARIVGTQAVFTLLAGERYKTITNEVNAYLQGRLRSEAPGEVDCELQTPMAMVTKPDDVRSGRT